MRRAIDEATVKQTLAERLTAGLGDRLFSVRKEVRLTALFAKTVYADVVVFDVDGKPIAVFEVKNYPQAWTIRKQLDSSLYRSYDTQGIKYSILTDGNEFWIWAHNHQEYLRTDFDSVVETIKNGLPVLGDIPTIEQISEAVENAATKTGLKQKNTIRAFLDRPRTRNLFRTDAKTGKIEFSTPSAEDAFFSYLLNGRIPSKLCRFTTRHNLFLLFKDGKQNMCSIVCMNDRSEETYADKKVSTQLLFVVCKI